MPTSRPTMLGGLRPPTPRAATLTPGHEPPDPHGTGTGSRPSLPGQAPGAPECPDAPGRIRPLPDPVAVRLCRIPDPAPPYDGEAARSSGSTAASCHAEAGDDGAEQGSACAEQGSACAEHGSSAQRDGRVQQDGRAAQRDNSSLAPPPGWPSRFAQVLAETLAGARPPGQLTPWTTEMARAHIQRLGPQLASGQQPRVRRVVTFQPTPEVMEMTVVVGFGTRVRALAVRLERAGPHPQAGDRAAAAPRWLCTAVEAA